MYNPDKWLIIHLRGKPFLFGTWSGGYMGSDSWRRNSGIEEVIPDGDNHYIFRGRSGSEYRCHKCSYGTTAFGMTILRGEVPEESIMSESEAEEFIQQNAAT